MPDGRSVKVVAAELGEERDLAQTEDALAAALEFQILTHVIGDRINHGADQASTLQVLGLSSYERVASGRISRDSSIRGCREEN
jgi:hypothetical protein